MYNCILQTITAISLCLNPDFLPEKTQFYYKSETIECVKRGPWPIIYIKQPFWSETVLDSCIQVIMSLCHYGLINMSDYFRFHFEEHYKWLFQNINKIVSISEITVSFQYVGIGEKQKRLSRVQTDYLRNQSEWSVYSINNYLPKKERFPNAPVIQEFHIDTHNCKRFLRNVYILNQNCAEIIMYFSSFIVKSWRRHKAFLYQLPEEFCRQGRIKHRELPQKMP